VPLLPLTSTVIYGSNDGGSTVHASSEIFNSMMIDSAKILHLSEHPVASRKEKKTIRLHSAGDVEGRIGKDSRFYLLDLSRTFPCEAKTVTTHLQNLGNSEYYRMVNETKN
jgi:hypothetical protein